MAEKATKTPKGKTKKAETEVTSTKQEAAAKARAAREARASNDVFKFVKQPGEGDKKLPKQAQGIVNILEAASEEGRDGMSRTDLCEAMTQVIETRQPIGRILTYYQKPLVEGGYVEIVKATPVVSETAEETSE